MGKKTVGIGAGAMLEGKSVRAMESLLSPWLVSWNEGRFDFGRDGIIQPLHLGEDGSGVADQQLVPFQLKATGSEAPQIARKSLEVHHLQFWELHPTFGLMMWFEQGGEFRWRTAKEVTRELDTVRPGWRDQTTTTVEFRAEHRVRSSLAKEKLLRRCRDECDQAGGRTAFNSAVRRIVLSDVLMEGHVTSNILTLEAEKDTEEEFRMGPGWQAGDLLAWDVDTHRQMVGALMLFEEVHMPLGYAGKVFTVLGEGLAKEMIRQGRIRFFEFDRVFGLFVKNNVNRGKPTSATINKDETWSRARNREWFINQRTSFRWPQGGSEVRDLLMRSTRFLPDGSGAQVEAETKRDLKNPGIRQLLGLSPFLSDTEPKWDSELVNRLFHLNQAQLAAILLRADVVEYESGMSRLAAEKWYSEIKFHRQFPVARALDAALRASSLPDLGMLSHQLGVGACCSLALSTDAQDLRDWFWKDAAPALTQEPNEVDAEVRAWLRAHAGEWWPEPTHRLHLGMLGQRSHTSVGGGFSSRASEPNSALRRQHRRHRQRRAVEIQSATGGTLPERLAPCPCGAPIAYGSCCGAKPTSS